MPRYSPKSGRVPKLRRHATGCGTCKLNGRDVYFRGAWPKGKKTAPKAIQEQYERCISEWLAAGRQLLASGTGMTVAQLVQRYTPEVEKRYQKRQEDGTMQRTQNVVVIKIALRHLRKGWGTVEAREFRALALQAYVSHLERYINPVTAPRTACSSRGSRWASAGRRRARRSAVSSGGKRSWCWGWERCRLPGSGRRFRRTRRRGVRRTGCRTRLHPWPGVR